MDSVQFLDAVRAKHDLPSDRKLAAFLNIPGGRVSLYRTGTRKLDPDACLKVAKAWGAPVRYTQQLADGGKRQETTEEIRVRCQGAADILNKTPGVHAVCIPYQ
jgi:hypothetical protein